MAGVATHDRRIGSRVHCPILRLPNSRLERFLEYRKIIFVLKTRYAIRWLALQLAIVGVAPGYLPYESYDFEIYNYNAGVVVG
jgi:hypothetical protein